MNAMLRSRSNADSFLADMLREKQSAASLISGRKASPSLYMQQKYSAKALEESMNERRSFCLEVDTVLVEPLLHIGPIVWDVAALRFDLLKLTSQLEKESQHLVLTLIQNANKEAKDFVEDASVLDQTLPPTFWGGFRDWWSSFMAQKNKLQRGMEMRKCLDSLIAFVHRNRGSVDIDVSGDFKPANLTRKIEQCQDVIAKRTKVLRSKMGGYIAMLEKALLSIEDQSKVILNKASFGVNSHPETNKTVALQEISDFQEITDKLLRQREVLLNDFRAMLQETGIKDRGAWAQIEKPYTNLTSVYLTWKERLWYTYDEMKTLPKTMDEEHLNRLLRMNQTCTELARELKQMNPLWDGTDAVLESLSEIVELEIVAVRTTLKEDAGQ